MNPYLPFQGLPQGLPPGMSQPLSAQPQQTPMLSAQPQQTPMPQAPLPSGGGALPPSGPSPAALPQAVPGDPNGSLPLIDRPYDDPERNKWESFLMGSLSTMEAAGRPGATALSAIGSGGKAGIQNYVGREKEIRANKLAKDSLGVKQALASARQKQADAAMKKAQGGSAIAQEATERTGFAIGHPKHTAMMEEIRGGMSDNEAEGLIKKITDPNTPPDQKAMFVKRFAAINDKKSAMVDLAKALTAGDKKNNQLYWTRQTESIDKGEAAVPLLRSSMKLREMLYSGTPTGTGLGAASELQGLAETLDFDLDKALKVVGLDGLGSLTGKEQISSASNKLVLSILAGKTLGANPSNRDLQVIVASVANLGLNEETNLALLDAVDKRGLEDAERGYKGHKRVENSLPKEYLDSGVDPDSVVLRGHIDSLKTQRETMRRELEDVILGEPNRAARAKSDPVFKRQWKMFNLLQGRN